jgi:hypothetical protein
MKERDDLVIWKFGDLVIKEKADLVIWKFGEENDHGQYLIPKLLIAALVCSFAFFVKPGLSLPA